MVGNILVILFVLLFKTFVLFFMQWSHLYAETISPAKKAQIG